LDVVIGKGAAVFEVLAGEDESLLIGWYRLFVLDLLLDIFDRVRLLNVEHDQIS
jgi:hypothetical protein